MTLKEFLENLKQETTDYMNSIVPRNIDGMPVERMCELGEFFGFPTIEFYIWSAKYEKHETLFGMKYREQFKLLDKMHPDWKMAHDYYQARLQNKVEEMYLEYCKQICRHEKTEKEDSQ